MELSTSLRGRAKTRMAYSRPRVAAMWNKALPTCATERGTAKVSTIELRERATIAGRNTTRISGTLTTGKAARRASVWIGKRMIEITSCWKAIFTINRSERVFKRQAIRLRTARFWTAMLTCPAEILWGAGQEHRAKEKTY